MRDETKGDSPLRWESFAKRANRTKTDEDQTNKLPPSFRLSHTHKTLFLDFVFIIFSSRMICNQLEDVLLPNIFVLPFLFVRPRELGPLRRK